VGVISSRDLLDPPAKGLAPPAQRWEGLASVAIEEAMNASPEVVTPTHSLEDAASRMVTLRIGCLPVVEPSPEGPRVLGLITESDLLRAAYDPWFHRTGD
jgi:CBS-domain-containing membrane protein